MAVRWWRFHKINIGLSLIICRVIALIMLCLAVNNLISGWSLAILNLCFIFEPNHDKNLPHSIQRIGRDFLTSVWSMSFFSFTLLVMSLLNAYKLGKWIVTDYHVISQEDEDNIKHHKPKIQPNSIQQHELPNIDIVEERKIEGVAEMNESKGNPLQF